MRETRFKRCLEATTSELASALAGHGFASNWELIDDGAYRRRFCRQGTWKRDVAEIVYRRGGELRLIINLAVEFLGPSSDWLRVPVTCPLTPRIPSFCPQWRARRYASRVGAMVTEAIGQFDQLATPERSLAFLDSISSEPGRGFYSVRTALAVLVAG